MEREYGNLVNAAVELDQYSGYQSTDDQKVAAQATGNYNSTLTAFVYDLLKDGKSGAVATELVNADLAEIAAASNPDWHNTYESVRLDILARIDNEADKKPWQRTLRRRLPLILLAIVILGYMGTRWYSATPVDQPIETKAGLIQRAAALHKAARYTDWHPEKVRRGGWFVELVFWPIEPTEIEVKSAGELAGLLFGGAQEMQSAGVACGVPVPRAQEEVGAAAMAYLDDTALYLQDPATRWQSPPVATIIERIRNRYPCR